VSNRRLFIMWNTILKLLDLSFCPPGKYKARARLVYAQAMTGAVLFQFSRYPQFLTAGFGVSIGSDILSIYMQLFVNCTAKLQKIDETGRILWLYLWG
jgi:hypothetical protein